MDDLSGPESNLTKSKFEYNFKKKLFFQILTKDSVTVAVDAVVYYRINNPMLSVTNVEDASRSTRLLSQTTLRNILGTKTLAEVLSDRENVSHMMQVNTL